MTPLIRENVGSRKSSVDLYSDINVPFVTEVPSFTRTLYYVDSRRNRVSRDYQNPGVVHHSVEGPKSKGGW